MPENQTTTPENIAANCPEQSNPEPASALPAEERSVYVSTLPEDPGEEIVDSETGRPWHLVSTDRERHSRVVSGEVYPVRRKDFKQSLPPQNAGNEPLS